jgi:hypothetical protein
MKPNRLGVRLTTLALAILFAATTEGCGLLIVKGPPVGHEQMEYFTCTEGDAGPIIDLVWGGLNVVGALVCASDPDAYENSVPASSADWDGVLSRVPLPPSDSARRRSVETPNNSWPSARRNSARRAERSRLTYGFSRWSWFPARTLYPSASSCS